MSTPDLGHCTRKMSPKYLVLKTIGEYFQENRSTVGNGELEQITRE